MNRQQFRKLQRTRAQKEQKAIFKGLGLPKCIRQFASNHGVMPEEIRNERLKYPG